MNPGNNVGNPAIHFGRQVKKARREHGWTIRDLNKKTGLSPGYISDVENGNRGPTERTALKMDAAFPEKRGWFSDYYNDSQQWAPPGYKSLAEYENASAHLWIWCPSVLHGLVQTEAYARAHLAVTDDPPVVINARLTARMERQQRVLFRENPPMVWVLVDESALFRLVGSPEIMAAQMDHLLAMAALPNITLFVVPALTHAVIASELIVMDNAAYAEHVAGGYVFTDQETKSSLEQLIARLQGESYRASDSARLIERVKDAWTTASPGESLLTALLREARASK